MMNVLTLNREVRDGKYSDVMDVMDYLGEGVYGSAANALDAIVKETPKFQETVKSKEFQAWRKKQLAEAGS